MNWKHETWRKLYVREEGTFAQLPLFCRALAAELLKLCDDQGHIYIGGDKTFEEVVAFRLGATRGDRRMLRQMIPLLFDDGYLVQDGNRVALRNFEKAQGRPRSGNDADATEQRPGHDGATTEQRRDYDAVTTEQRPSNESERKSAKSLRTPVDTRAPARAVPFRSVPSVPSEERETPAREPKQRPFLPKLFGEVRSRMVGGLPWQSLRAPEKASRMADLLGDDDSAWADVERSMELLFRHAKAGRYPRSDEMLRDPTFAFGVWGSKWTELREEIHGRAPHIPEAAKPRAAEPFAVASEKRRIEQATDARIERLAEERRPRPPAKTPRQEYEERRQATNGGSR